MRLTDLVFLLHQDLSAQAEAGNELVTLFPLHPFVVGSRNGIDQKDLSCLKRERQRARIINNMSCFVCQLRLKGIFYLGLWQSQ